jgi:hypothetical protein
MGASGRMWAGMQGRVGQGGWRSRHMGHVLARHGGWRDPGGRLTPCKLGGRASGQVRAQKSEVAELQAHLAANPVVGGRERKARRVLDL